MSSTDLVGGLQKVRVVVGERSEVLLVLAAVGDVFLEDLSPVDGRGATVTSLEVCPMMRGRSSPARTSVFSNGVGRYQGCKGLQRLAKKRSLGCVNFLPLPAWLLLDKTKTGPFFSPSMYYL